MKLNLDAAYYVSSKVAKLGVVGRDFRGDVKFCAVTQRRDVQSPLQAKLLAVLFGMEIAREHNFQAVYLEMDSKLTAIEI